MGLYMVLRNDVYKGVGYCRVFQSDLYRDLYGYSFRSFKVLQWISRGVLTRASSLFLFHTGIYSETPMSRYLKGPSTHGNTESWNRISLGSCLLSQWRMYAKILSSLSLVCSQCVRRWLISRSFCLRISNSN